MESRLTPSMIQRPNALTGDRPRLWILSTQPSPQVRFLRARVSGPRVSDPVSSPAEAANETPICGLITGPIRRREVGVRIPIAPGLAIGYRSAIKRRLPLPPLRFFPRFSAEASIQLDDKLRGGAQEKGSVTLLKAQRGRRARCPKAVGLAPGSDQHDLDQVTPNQVASNAGALRPVRRVISNP